MGTGGEDKKKGGVAQVLPANVTLSALTGAELEAFVAGYLRALSGAERLEKDLEQLGRHDLAQLVSARLRGSETVRTTMASWHRALKKR